MTGFFINTMTRQFSQGNSRTPWYNPNRHVPNTRPRYGRSYVPPINSGWRVTINGATTPVNIDFAPGIQYATNVTSTVITTPAGTFHWDFNREIVNPPRETTRIDPRDWTEIVPEDNRAMQEEWVQDIMREPRFTRREPRPPQPEPARNQQRVRLRARRNTISDFQIGIMARSEAVRLSQKFFKIMERNVHHNGISFKYSPPLVNDFYGFWSLYGINIVRVNTTSKYIEQVHLPSLQECGEFDIGKIHNLTRYLWRALNVYSKKVRKGTYFHLTDGTDGILNPGESLVLPKTPEYYLVEKDLFEIPKGSEYWQRDLFPPF